MSTYQPVPNKIRVCHFPQIPCKPFIVEVNNEREAYLIEQVFANQHLWLFENKIIPDYCNAITVEMWEGEIDHDGDMIHDWVDYWNESECMEWEEFKQTYFETTDDDDN